MTGFIMVLFFPIGYYQVKQQITAVRVAVTYSSLTDNVTLYVRYCKYKSIFMLELNQAKNVMFISLIGGS